VPESTIWKDTYQTVANALDLEVSTVKRLVKIGEYPAIKIGAQNSKRPIVRLMPPAEFQARKIASA